MARRGIAIIAVRGGGGGGGGEMVLVDISTLADRICLIMHILIVSNDSQLPRDDFRVFQNFLAFFGPDKPFWDRKYQLS